jgi:hypothetical protein
MVMMKLRRFNDSGLAEFREQLLTLKSDPTRDPPWHLLADARFTTPANEVELERKVFKTRMEVALAMNGLLGDRPPPGTDRDTGLWSWLALFHFDSICPFDETGRRKVGAAHRYILEGTNHKTYYRHLLLGPYLILRAHRDEPERAIVLLCQSPDSPGDIVEQLASRQEIVTNPVMMRVATELYYDWATGAPKRGASSKNRGSARRLAEVTDQFDVTWDLFAVPWHSLLARLPAEFDRFRPQPKSTTPSSGASIPLPEQDEP